MPENGRLFRAPAWAVQTRHTRALIVQTEPDVSERDMSPVTECPLWGKHDARIAPGRCDLALRGFPTFSLRRSLYRGSTQRGVWSGNCKEVGFNCSGAYGIRDLGRGKQVLS